MDPKKFFLGGMAVFLFPQRSLEKTVLYDRPEAGHRNGCIASTECVPTHSKSGLSPEPHMKEFFVLAERERKRELKVMLNDREMELLEERCRENHESKAQIIRELIVLGFNYYVDYDRLQNVAKELNAIGNNINQIARRVNSTGSIYKDDVEDVRKELDEIWLSLRSTLSGQVFKKQ